MATEASESGDSNVRNATGGCAGARSTFPGVYLRAETARGGPPDHRAKQLAAADADASGAAAVAAPKLVTVTIMAK